MPKVNGFINYQTWVVYLHLSNDYSMYSAVRLIVIEHEKSGTLLSDEQEEELKSLVEYVQQKGDIDMTCDLDVVSWAQLTMRVLEELNAPEITSDKLLESWLKPI